MTDNEAVGCVILVGFFCASVAFSLSVGMCIGVGWGIATFLSAHGLLALAVAANSLENRHR